MDETAPVCKAHPFADDWRVNGKFVISSESGETVIPLAYRKCKVCGSFEFRRIYLREEGWQFGKLFTFPECE